MDAAKIIEALTGLSNSFYNWASLESVNWYALFFITIVLFLLLLFIKYIFKRRETMRNSHNRGNNVTRGDNSPIINNGGANHLLAVVALLVIVIGFLAWVYLSGDSSKPINGIPTEESKKTSVYDVPEMIVNVSGISEDERGKATVTIERLNNSHVPLFVGMQPIFNSAEDSYYFSNLKRVDDKEMIKVTVRLKGYKTDSKTEIMGKSVSFSLQRSL